MNLLKVATSALTGFLFHLPCLSSVAHVWRVLCCAVLCCVVLCCAACCVLCCVSGVEQLYQARRMIGGIGNTFSQT